MQKKKRVQKRNNADLIWNTSAQIGINKSMLSKHSKTKLPQLKNVSKLSKQSI